MSTQTPTRSDDRTDSTSRPTTPSHPWLVVTVREVVVKLTDKSFILSTALMVALIVAGVGISGYMAARTTTFEVGTLDEATTTLAQGAQAEIAAAGDDLQVTGYDSEDALRTAVLEGEASVGLLETPDGFSLMGADAPPEMVRVTYGNNVSVSVSGDSGSADDPRRCFSGLAEGGEVREPLQHAPWGDEFGMLVDRYGISWLVNIAGS